MVKDAYEVNQYKRKTQRKRKKDCFLCLRMHVFAQIVLFGVMCTRPVSQAL